MKTNSFKCEKSYTSSKDLQLLEIDKQLKNIQTQKKAINQLIFKDLKTIKYNWQDVRDKAKMRNMSSNNVSHVKKLCETLDKTSQQVDSLYRSFTEFDKTKNNRFGNVNLFSTVDNTFEVEFDKGDNNQLTPWKNYNKALQVSSSNVANNKLKHYVKDKANNIKESNNNEITQNSLVNYSSNFENIERIQNAKNSQEMENMYSNPKNTFTRLGNLNDPSSSYDKIFMDNTKELLKKENDAQSSTSLLSDKEKCPRTFNSEINQSTKKICNVSSQNDTTATTNFMNKYPTLRSIFPKVFNSKYLRKSCGFD
jgi:hypothetical protein